MKLKDIVQVRDLEISCIKEYFAEILENKWESLPQQWKDDLGASSKKSLGTYLDSGLSFVAEEDGEIFGFIFAQMLHYVNNTENLVWIENMGVHPYPAPAARPAHRTSSSVPRRRYRASRNRGSYRAAS